MRRECTHKLLILFRSLSARLKYEAKSWSRTWVCPFGTLWTLATCPNYIDLKAEDIYISIDHQLITGFYIFIIIWIISVVLKLKYNRNVYRFFTALSFSWLAINFASRGALGRYEDEVQHLLLPHCKWCHEIMLAVAYLLASTKASWLASAYRGVLVKT